MILRGFSSYLRCLAWGVGGAHLNSGFTRGFNSGVTRGFNSGVTRGFRWWGFGANSGVQLPGFLLTRGLLGG